MVRELREAAACAGDKLPDKDIMMIMIYRWERGGSGISERYRLHYSAAFKTPADHFGDPSILEALHPSQANRSGTGHLAAAEPRSARDRMQATLNQAGDPVTRDQMCFMLGYLSALMTTGAPTPRHRAVPGDTASAQGSR